MDRIQQQQHDSKYIIIMSGESLTVVSGESAAATNNGMIDPLKASSSCTGNDDEQESYS